MSSKAERKMVEMLTRKERRRRATPEVDEAVLGWYHQQQGKYTLIGFDGQPYKSHVPGTLGGHRKLKIYGRLDCPSALRFIANGQYVQHRVFFANEEDALGAGYRPCARCLPEKYKEWK